MCESSFFPHHFIVSKFFRQGSATLDCHLYISLISRGWVSDVYRSRDFLLWIPCVCHLFRSSQILPVMHHVCVLFTVDSGIIKIWKVFIMCNNWTCFPHASKCFLSQYSGNKSSRCLTDKEQRASPSQAEVKFFMPRVEVMGLIVIIHTTPSLHGYHYIYFQSACLSIVSLLKVASWSGRTQVASDL